MGPLANDGLPRLDKQLWIEARGCTSRRPSMMVCILSRLACMPLRSPAQTHVNTNVNRHIFQALATPPSQLLSASLTKSKPRSTETILPGAFARHGAAQPHGVETLRRSNLQPSCAWPGRTPVHPSSSLVRVYYLHRSSWPFEGPHERYCRNSDASFHFHNRNRACVWSGSRRRQEHGSHHSSAQGRSKSKHSRETRAAIVTTRHET
jgi:hypothetical protein